MQIYLLRHTDANTVAAHDDDRFLSDKGVQQAQRIARFCEAHQIRPSVIFTSPLRRAHQTAKFVADALGAEMRTVLWLSSGAQPGKLLAELAEYRGTESVMIVGHEPDFSQFAAHVTGLTEPANLHIRKGTLACLEMHEFRPGGGRLEYVIPVKLM